MRRPIRRSTPCRMSIIRSRTRRLCASWPAGWRLRPNSASTRRRPGFDVFGDRLVGLSFAVEPFEAWYVPCDPANLGQVLSILRPVFENERIAKIGQNVKFDLMMLRSAGIDVRGTLYDTMIVHYLLDPESASRHGSPGAHLSELFARCRSRS